MAEFRQWREENRTYLKDVVPLDTPYNLQIEVSSLCNARCRYCGHARPDHGVWEGNMPWTLLQEILKQAKGFAHRLKLVEMFGFGEPLCNPRFAEMIAAVRQADIAERINFTTNGLLFTPQKIDAILAAGVDTIRVSLQGLDASKYRDVCGVHMDFEAFRENLCYLYDHRGSCKIRMKIADIAIKDVPDGEARLQELFGDRADSLFIEHILPMYAGIDYDALSSDIRQNAIHGRENVKQTEIHKVCHRPFYRLRVGADGAVTAACCDTPHDIRYGHLPEDNLVSLWNEGGHMSFLKMQLEGKRFQHPICKDCMLPNDITNEADLLDPWAKELLERMK